MMRCTELAKKGNRSVVEIRNTDTERIEKYVVCENFDNSKAYGNKWDNGIYYDVYGSTTDSETKLEKAMRKLYGVEENPISYDRLFDLSEKFIEKLEDDLVSEDFINFMSKLLTPDEADEFGIKETIFPKRYKVVTVSMKREQTVQIQVIMPDDVDTYDVDDYIENTENIDDGYYDIESEDWEIDDWDIDRGDMSKEDVDNYYNLEDLWNYSDIDEI